MRRSEFWLMMAALLGVVLVGVLEGIAVAVGLSILNVFRRVWWPYMATLVRVPGLAGFHDSHQYPDSERLPGLVLLRFDAPLIFANARTFRDRVRHLAKRSPRPRWILIAAEPITDVDTTAGEMLEELDIELNEKGTFLVFAEMKTRVMLKIERYGLLGTLDERHFFPTMEAALETFQKETGAQWERKDQNGADRPKA
jgi:MFS superfamily sulfate permease-like transporter